MCYLNQVADALRRAVSRRSVHKPGKAGAQRLWFAIQPPLIYINVVGQEGPEQPKEVGDAARSAEAPFRAVCLPRIHGRPRGVCECDQRRRSKPDPKVSNLLSTTDVDETDLALIYHYFSVIFCRG
jgi:hypothetical protein